VLRLLISKQNLPVGADLGHYVYFGVQGMKGCFARLFCFIFYLINLEIPLKVKKIRHKFQEKYGVIQGLFRHFLLDFIAKYKQDAGHKFCHSPEYTF
jgi:hypothetical protein